MQHLESVVCAIAQRGTRAHLHHERGRLKRPSPRAGGPRDRLALRVCGMPPYLRLGEEVEEEDRGRDGGEQDRHGRKCARVVIAEL